MEIRRVSKRACRSFTWAAKTAGTVLSGYSDNNESDWGLVVVAYTGTEGYSAWNVFGRRQSHQPMCEISSLFGPSNLVLTMRCPMTSIKRYLHTHRWGVPRENGAARWSHPPRP